MCVDAAARGPAASAGSAEGAAIVESDPRATTFAEKERAPAGIGTPIATS